MRHQTKSNFLKPRRPAAAVVLLFLVAAVLAASTTSFGQAPRPSAAPTPPPAAGEDPVKISTALIQLDVTVTDKDGKIVTGLKPEDFEIFENDEKQPIASFSFVSSGPARAGEAATKASGAATDSATTPPATAPQPGRVRRTIALVVDDFSLNRESIISVRQALRKFVDEQMQDDDLVAIVRLSKGSGAAQQFTSDRKFLRAAIEQVSWYYLSGGGGGAFESLAASPLERARARAEKADDVPLEKIEAEKQSLQSMSNYQSKVFSHGTLGSLNYIVGGMRDLPGRKSVMLFSDGFKLVVKENGSAEQTAVKEAIRKIAEVANRASVVIYTSDARGLQTTALGVQDNIGDVSQSRISSVSTERSTQIFDTQEGLVELARQTGGVPFLNNNNLNAGIGKMLDDQTGYYLLAYVPDAETFDPKNLRFNRLTVKVRRPDLKVRTRSGFVGVPDQNPPPGRQTPAEGTATAKQSPAQGAPAAAAGGAAKQTLSAAREVPAAAAQTPSQRIAAALNSPFAVKGVDLRLNALFASDAQTGPFLNSTVYINAKDLKFTEEPDGGQSVTFDILAVSFGENNQVIDQLSKNYKVTLTGETYEDTLRDGLLYNFVFPVKKSGFYHLRVGLRDASSDKIGTASQFIEIPDLKAGLLTLSGIVLENLTMEDFQNQQQGTSEGDSGADSTSALDTSLRRFKQGTVLKYGYEIYNAKLDASQKPQLTAQTKIFRDGKVLLEGKQTPLDLTGQAGQKFSAFGALSLGAGMPPGDYVLQVTVTDHLSKEKKEVAAQFVQFEIVN